MEEVHEEVGYWFIHVNLKTKYEYINQYEAHGTMALMEYNFLDQSTEDYIQLAVF